LPAEGFDRAIPEGWRILFFFVGNKAIDKKTLTTLDKLFK
jgi:hypothetical protein